MQPTTTTIGIGRRLGAFVLREQIGEGGFGAVYLADQEVLQREAVIKVSRPTGLAEATRVDQFLQEARLASRIDHPFAAHVYEFGAESDGTLWIAMELVRGTTLSDMLAAGPLPRQRAIPLLSRLCEVIHTLHEQGIVHRDIKPHNVMVISRAGNMFPKLLDLGIASDLAKSVATSGQGQVVAVSSGMAGTPMYMAPEQWVNGAPISPATDVYALGVLAFEVLTGTPPFSGNTVMELATQHARKAPPSLPSEFAIDLSDVLAKAMAKRPKDRYTTALAFGVALRDASGLAIEAVDLPAIDPTLRDEMLIAAPHPLAECIAMIDAARTPASLRRSVWKTAYVLAAYIGNIALAARQRATGRYGDAPEVKTLLTKLKTNGLDASQWWQLSRELMRPFAETPALYPVPELVEVFFAGGSALRNAMETLLESERDDPGDKASADEIRTFLVGAVSLLGKALQAVRFLSRYSIAVVRNGEATYWMGLRRNATMTQSRAGEQDGILLLDGNDELACDLSAVASCSEPNPGAAHELFWLVGAHQDKAKLQALPHNLELRRDDLWHIHLGSHTDEDSRLASGDVGAGAAEDAPPYLGLATFGTGDSNRYFGREAEVVGFVNRMHGRRFIAVVGPSGSGKSSFVQAGVLPNLPTQHQAVVLRPGGSPLESLSLAFGKCGVSLPPEDLAREPGALAKALEARQRAARDAMPLLLVIDQFEELVTMCLDAAMQARFAAAMLAIANLSGLNAHVIITLRDDFLIRVAQVPGLRERLSASLHLLTTPLEDDLQRILTEPARRVGYSFEDQALIKEIAQEVASQSAALALLSFTAYQLWQFRDQHFKKLTRKAYQALGGVGGALAHHAESVMSSLGPAEQKSVREIFRHLVTADGTRASLSRDEILQISGGAQADAVLERLIGARLLVAQEGADKSERIEVIHEALLSAWPRLVQWRHEDAEGARMRDQLRVAAKQWVDRGRDKGLLWRGDTLVEFRIWRSRYPGSITKVEEEFADGSIKEALKTQRLRRVAFSVFTIAMVVATVVFAKLRFDAVASEGRANAQLTETYVEHGRRAILANEPTTALLYLHRALRRNSADEALSFMLSRVVTPLQANLATLNAHAAIFSVVGSPDKKRLLTSGADGTAKIIDVATKSVVHTFSDARADADSVMLAVWIGNSKVATASQRGVVRVWDVVTGKQLMEKQLQNEEVNSLAYHEPSGSVLIGSADLTVKRWMLSSDQMALVVDAKNETPGLWIFSQLGSSFSIMLWQFSTRAGKIWLLDHHGSSHQVSNVIAAGLDFSPQPGVLALIEPSRFVVSIRQVSDWKVLKTLAGHEKPVTAMAFSASGSIVATGSEDSAIRLFNIIEDKVAVLRGHTGAVLFLRFLSDDRMISLSVDGTAKLWDVKHEILLLTLAHTGKFSGETFDPETTTLATASESGTVKFWHIGEESMPHTIGQGGDASLSFFHPPLIVGDVVYYADNEGFSRWNVREKTMVRRVTGGGHAGELGLLDSALLIGLDGNGMLTLMDPNSLAVVSQLATDVAHLAISPLGDAYVTINRSNEMTWHLADGSVKGRFQLFSGDVFRIAWSANGEVVAVLGDLIAWVFDAKSKQLRAKIKSGTLYDLKLTSDGKHLIEVGEQTEGLWDVDGNRITTMLQPSKFATESLSPQGDRLYVGMSDGNVAVWSLPEGKRIATMQGASGAYYSLAVGRDLIFGATRGNEVLVWDVKKFRLVARLPVNKNTIWVGVNSENTKLLTIDRAGSLTVNDISRIDSQLLGSSFLETLIEKNIDDEQIVRSGLSVK